MSETQAEPPAAHGSLTHWGEGEFVPIAGVDGTSYGGRQSWLTGEGVSGFYADRSCGVTAACNLLCYLSRHWPGKEGLYPRRGLSQERFSRFQRELYGYLSPTPWGVPTIGKMIRGVERYARDRGVSLRAVRAGHVRDEAAALAYISAGLERDCPVLLLTWNTPVADLRFHWVTVTRLYGAGGGIRMVTSNWGERVEYDFSAWVKGPSLHRGAVWFE